MAKSILVTGGILLAAASFAAPASAQDCLFADVGSPPPSQCTSDVYNVGTEPMVVRAATRLGFSPTQLRFRGCAIGRFGTAFKSDEGVYLISYPLSSHYAFAEYVGPLAHEIGHAVQISEAGSMPAFLHAMPDSARRELGADFLAGFIFRRFMENLDQQGFEESLDLLGNYQGDVPATHSEPEARTVAFRMGFSFQEPSVTIFAAHREFQRNRFGAIVNAMLR